MRLPLWASIGLVFLSFLPMPMQGADQNVPLWGAYVGWKPEDGPAFEKKVGSSMQLRAVFVHWGNENAFPLALHLVMEGKTLVIFWEAMDYTVNSVEQPAYSYSAILRGDWDVYIRRFARQAAAYGKPVILIPFEEMNGDWYPWSGTQNGNSAAEHVAAYRYLHKFFTRAPHVQFGWAVNAASVPDSPSNAMDRYYPGSAYVDVVGVDGFNSGDPWQSFDEIFPTSLRQLSKYKKPVYIFSMASAEGPKKSAWITDALMRQIPLRSMVKGWIWFHENKERDWRVWSDTAALKAFRKALP